MARGLTRPSGAPLAYVDDRNSAITDTNASNSNNASGVHFDDDYDDESKTSLSDVRAVRGGS